MQFWHLFRLLVGVSSCDVKQTTSCHMHNTLWTPNIFTDSGPSIKGPLVGLIKGAPNTPYAPYGSGQNFLWGVRTDGPFRP